MALRDVRTFLRNYAEREPCDYESRSVAYYWERKRKLALDLLATHAATIAAASASGSPLLVDLGCGYGFDMAMFMTFLDEQGVAAGKPFETRWRAIGIEGFPECFEAARERLNRMRLENCEIRVANITKPLPLNDAEVDILFCSEVLEHIPHDDGKLDKVLAEMHRVVRPGGYVLMTTPNQPNVFQRSYWSRARREAVRAAYERMVHSAVDINGEKVDIYAHVTLHLAHEWDRIFAEHGFDCADYRRGAAFYGGFPLLSRTPVHQLRMTFEWLLDRLPLSWSRELSDQVIALYRKKP